MTPLLTSVLPYWYQLQSDILPGLQCIYDADLIKHGFRYKMDHPFILSILIK